MARDMQKFVAVFANCITQSAPHIYLSALPFSPRGSAVWARYMQGYPCTLRIQTGGLTSWPAMQSVLSGHNDWVQSVAFSPGGHRIVSGSCDQTIRVWDAQTGEMVVGPLEGHSGYVLFVAFSPDGHRIVSGSGD
jgi:WD40 repeat protein